MGRDAVLNDCAQQLRQSSFEFEQLLGSSVDAVWQALSSYVERQLLARKGVSVALLGKFAFLREVQPLAPVFVLADRFASAYGVSWKRPPPALLTPTVDASMSLIGGAVGLPKEQTLRALEALIAFLGSRLQKGTASGRLRLGNVGALCFEGKALSFAFHPSFVKAVNHGALSSRVEGGRSTRKAAVEELRVANTPLQRSASTNSGIPVVQRVTSPSAEPAAAVEDEQECKSHHHRKKNRQSHQHRHSRSAARLDAPPALAPDCPAELLAAAAAARPVLPRFLVASKSVPDGAKVNRQVPSSPYALALHAAFEREREQRAASAQALASEDATLVRRHHTAQLRKLQESAERAIGRRELNAFLSGQIADKHAAQRAERLAAARAGDVLGSASILPRDAVVPAEARREAKRSLCRRLGEQVAAKDALARDRRALEQAEAAYFSAQLQAQTAEEQRERLERKRADTQALLDGWRQQRDAERGR